MESLHLRTIVGDRVTLINETRKTHTPDTHTHLPVAKVVGVRTRTRSSLGLLEVGHERLATRLAIRVAVDARQATLGELLEALVAPAAGRKRTLRR